MQLSASIKFFFVILFLIQSVWLQGQSPKREMRAVWITTLKSIDWPSNRFNTMEQHKQEFKDLLDLHQRNGMNAVIVQIRPSADAFYASKYEPWSEWLTGKQGKAPDPYFDPLEFMIEEAHKRDLEFHAWFNPFRVVSNVETADISPDNVIYKHPEWVFQYGINKYLDPGIPMVRDYLLQIVMDVVARYNIDGVHFDDYFYPYPEKGEKLPDEATFRKYGAGFSTIDDWRRDNVNQIIEKLHVSIKNVKPYVKFGISPFGIWRNKRTDPRGSDTRGLENYDYLYADILLWLQNGWLDYVAPQLYWEVGSKLADFNTLVDWWSQHTYDRHLYIGHAVYRIDAASPNHAWRSSSQILNQIRITRQNPKVLGSFFYKSSSFRDNLLGINDSLRANLYNRPAMRPTMPWLKVEEVAVVEPPLAPTNLMATRIRRTILLSWASPEKTQTRDTAAYYAVYKFSENEAVNIENTDKIYAIVNQPYLMIERKRTLWFRKRFFFVVTAFDRLNNESQASNPVVVKLKE